MKKSVKKTRVLVFGTFDILHKGHMHFFQQARRLATNTFLIVSVARDVNVKKIKGQIPKNLERRRAAAVRAAKVADRVVLGSIKNYLEHIISEKPDIIALGYDQHAYTSDLRQKLIKKGHKIRIRRLKPHRPYKYKSSILKK